MCASRLHVVLPYPPATNAMYRTIGGRILLTKAARDYQDAIRVLALDLDLTPLTGPVVVEVRVYRPYRRGDLDNRLKVLLDAVQGVLYRDDEQIIEIHAYRHDDKADPRVEMTVWTPGAGASDDRDAATTAGAGTGSGTGGDDARP